jgi:flagellar protein FliO/FliZ
MLRIVWLIYVPIYLMLIGQTLAQSSTSTHAPSSQPIASQPANQVKGASQQQYAPHQLPLPYAPTLKQPKEATLVTDDRLAIPSHHIAKPIDPTVQKTDIDSAVQQPTTVPATAPVKFGEPALTKKDPSEILKDRYSTSPLLSRKTFFWTQLFGMLIALGIVVLLIYAILRWAAQKAGVHNPRAMGILHIRDRLSLEPKKSIWIIEIDGHYYLIATHEQGITLLERLDAQSITRQIEQNQQNTPSFWQRLITRRNYQLSNTKTASASESRPSTDQSPHPIPTQFEVLSDGQDSNTQK